jgi:intracellular sulfur oxidation DsrE/DsrF family protein
MNNKKQQVLKAVFLASVILGSTTAIAHNDNYRDRDDNNVANYLDSCDTLPLVNTLIGGPVNTTVCVDAPVALKKAKVVFNLDSTILSGDNPVGLRHMWMLGNALKARIQAGLLDPEKVSIIGVFHGSGSAWALKSSPDNVKGFIEKIFTLNNEGVNISLEMCGVTMLGKGWTNDNLYVSEKGKGYGFIHVNQGAIGRIIDLEQHGYAYIQENDANN